MGFFANPVLRKNTVFYFFFGAGVQPVDTEAAPDHMTLFRSSEFRQAHNKPVKPFNCNVHHVVPFCRFCTRESGVESAGRECGRVISWRISRDAGRGPEPATFIYIKCLLRQAARFLTAFRSSAYLRFIPSEMRFRASGLIVRFLGTASVETTAVEV